MTETIDVLWLAALQMELEAAQAVLADATGPGAVADWSPAGGTDAPYLRGEYRISGQGSFSVALARPVRMGPDASATMATLLAERLRPACIVMSGVCAGHPGDVALGDVVASEITYAYDEGKTTAEGFMADTRQSPAPSEWVRAAQEFKTDGLTSHGPPSPEDARFWFLERLYGGAQPARHPAIHRYFARGAFAEAARALEREGLIVRAGKDFALTDAGRDRVEGSLAFDIDPPERLPFVVRTGPMASGKVVVKDGVTWDRLRLEGVRSLIAIKMEAATVGLVARSAGVANWIVMKGVMDHADPNKDDRFKPFAARASAEVLERFLVDRLSAKLRPVVSASAPPPGAKSQWRPRSVEDPFFDEVRDALARHAPGWVGVFDLARSGAAEAYRAAADAQQKAFEARRVLRGSVKPYAKAKGAKPFQVQPAEVDDQGYGLIVKTWSSGDIYIGEGFTNGRAFGLGVTKTYNLSKALTPNQTSAYAGRHDDGYGPSGVFSYGDGSQFAGDWVDGRPGLGYREQLGDRGDRPDFDFYLGSMGCVVGDEGHYRPYWVYQGDGIGVNVACRTIVCGEFAKGALATEAACSPISF